MIETSIPTSHQFIRHTATHIEPGDSIDSWCTLHHDKTPHLWTGNRLICLLCHPELKPREETEE